MFVNKVGGGVDDLPSKPNFDLLLLWNVIVTWCKQPRRYYV